MTGDVFNGFEAVQLYAQENHERSRLKKIMAATVKVARWLYLVDITGDFVESQVGNSSFSRDRRNTICKTSA